VALLPLLFADLARDAPGLAVAATLVFWAILAAIFAAFADLT
jgi:hypothetical protein